MSIGLSRVGVNEVVSFTADPERLDLIAILSEITRVAMQGNRIDRASSFESGWWRLYAPMQMGRTLRIARIVATDDRACHFFYDLQKSGFVESESPMAGATGLSVGSGIPAPKAGAQTTMTMTLRDPRNAVNATDIPSWALSILVSDTLGSSGFLAGRSVHETQNTRKLAGWLNRVLGRPESPF